MAARFLETRTMIVRPLWRSFSERALYYNWRSRPVSVNCCTLRTQQPTPPPPCEEAVHNQSARAPPYPGSAAVWRFCWLENSCGIIGFSFGGFPINKVKLPTQDNVTRNNATHQVWLKIFIGHQSYIGNVTYTYWNRR